MRGFVANTDHDWFSFLRSLQPAPEEVNFWRPGSESSFKALQPGEPLFFKLKAPHHAIGGLGYFAHYSSLPLSMAWEVYGQANGAPTFATLRERLLRFRNRADMVSGEKHDFRIGCILVNQPVFFDDGDWVQPPADWDDNTGRGKTYDLASGEGQRIWIECIARAAAGSGPPRISDRPLAAATPALIQPRLGPRSFRVAVLDAYDRRCALTDERTLPALEAAHIREYDDNHQHSINNGILFRSDLRRLFETGYVTVTPDYRFEVSRRIKEEFADGREYYKLHGNLIRLPEGEGDRPLLEALWWHNERRYLG